MTLTYSGAKGTGIFFQWDGEPLALKWPSCWTLRATAQKVTLRFQSDWRALPHTHPKDHECSGLSLRSCTRVSNLFPGERTADCRWCLGRTTTTA